ncbi:MAG: peptidase [Oscillatoria sp. PMC 1051.18]|uniref:peptidase n=1 Tax=Oscillatoria salina TaxID=331517 RepID=UPI0013BA73F5|nr:peptidase [Oscillatoria salina]MBZ8180651.1 peptidase [Oscillatoria salina IIICB1]MEC4895111.1 peptidase [Oscillatoria sp. PMC 1050.18]MEC5031769.1 peptidase [Oscillatoria sp. PMC 1051.18]NET89680.1 peptidase [Kamptonema sp. SIO1D9]
MSRLFRKYHRLLGIIISLPLLLTIITGISYSIFDELLGQGEIGHLMLEIHTMEIIHLEIIYPLLNGLGLLGLLVTGLSMTNFFKKPLSKS